MPSWFYIHHFLSPSHTTQALLSVAKGRARGNGPHKRQYFLNRLRCHVGPAPQNSRVSIGQLLYGSTAPLRRGTAQKGWWKFYDCRVRVARDLRHSLSTLHHTFFFVYTLCDYLPADRFSEKQLLIQEYSAIVFCYSAGAMSG